MGISSSNSTITSTVGVYPSIKYSLIKKVVEYYSKSLDYEAMVHVSDF